MNENPSPDATSQTGEESSPKLIEALYARLRDYIQHEDELINHRTIWFVAINAFLIGTAIGAAIVANRIAERLRDRSAWLGALDTRSRDSTELSRLHNNAIAVIA